MTAPLDAYEITTPYLMKSKTWYARGRTPITATPVVEPPDQEALRVQVLRLMVFASPPVVVDPGNPSTRYSARTDRILGVIARPTGSNYVTIESAYLAGETPANTDFNVVLKRIAVANAAAPKIVTLAAATTYSFTGFPYEAGAIDVGLRLGSPGSGLAGVRGIVGQGRSTIIRNLPNSSSDHTKAMGSATPAAGIINVAMLYGQSVVNGEFRNFTLRGEEAGHYHDGIKIYNCTNFIIDNVYVQGANPGFKNAPPGETMAISSNNAPGLQILDCEVDGRRWDTKIRVSAAVIGINNTNGVTVKRFFGHHAKASMVTFYNSTNIYTEDVITFTNGTGNGGGINGAGINHERCYDRVEHVRPTTIVWGLYATDPVLPNDLAELIPDDGRTDATYGANPTQNSGIHFTGNVHIDDGRFMNPWIIRDPRFDYFDTVSGQGQRVLAVRIQDEYPSGRTPLSYNGQTYHPPEVYNAAGERMEHRRRNCPMLNFSGTPTSGSFTLRIVSSLGTFTTAAIPYTAYSNPQAIADAMNAVYPREQGSTSGTGDRSLRTIAVFNGLTAARKLLWFPSTGVAHTVTVTSSTLVGATLTVVPDRVSAVNGGIDNTKAFISY